MTDAQTRIRVLVIDDHPVVRDGYRGLLESAGDVDLVAEAEAGDSGYELFKQHRPDVVIMDLVMPGAGGLGAIRRIRQWEPASRVIFLSMYDTPIYKTKAFEAGASGYVSKRCAPGTMLEAIREVYQDRTFVAMENTGADPDELDSDERAALETLTVREFEVFSLLALGFPLQEVARQLKISRNTAGVHQTRIMHKLHLQNAAQLARLAIRHGIVSA